MIYCIAANETGDHRIPLHLVDRHLPTCTATYHIRHQSRLKFGATRGNCLSSKVGGICCQDSYGAKHRGLLGSNEPRPNSDTTSHDYSISMQSMFLKTYTLRPVHRLAPFTTILRCYRLIQQHQSPLVSARSMSSVTTHPSLTKVSTERQRVPLEL